MALDDMTYSDVRLIQMTREISKTVMFYEFLFLLNLNQLS